MRGTGTRRRRNVRQLGQTQGLRGYLCATAAAGIALGGIVYFKSRLNRVVAPPPLPSQARLTPEHAQALIHLMIFDNPVLPPKPFETRPAPKVELPNLNGQAGDYLTKVDGQWTDGSTVVVIRARGLQGRVGRADQAGRLQPLTVRDISGTMMVADIGSHRFILLRHPDGLSISGGSLAVPVKLHR